jgi:hypothetical protein
MVGDERCVGPSVFDHAAPGKFGTAAEAGPPVAAGIATANAIAISTAMRRGRRIGRDGREETGRDWKFDERNRGHLSAQRR